MEWASDCYPCFIYGGATPRGAWGFLNILPTSQEARASPHHPAGLGKLDVKTVNVMVEFSYRRLTLRYHCPDKSSVCKISAVMLSKTAGRGELPGLSVALEGMFRSP